MTKCHHAIYLCQQSNSASLQFYFVSFCPIISLFPGVKITFSMADWTMIALHDYFHNVTPRKKKDTGRGRRGENEAAEQHFPSFFSRQFNLASILAPPADGRTAQYERLRLCTALPWISSSFDLGLAVGPPKCVALLLFHVSDRASAWVCAHLCQKSKLFFWGGGEAAWPGLRTGGIEGRKEGSGACFLAPASPSDRPAVSFFPLRP